MATASTREFCNWWDKAFEEKFIFEKQYLCFIGFFSPFLWGSSSV
jgi:hypothetical protein